MSWSTEWDGEKYELPYRDSQRQKSYDAEHKCFAEHRRTKQLRKLSRETVQLMTDALWETDCVQELLRRGGRRSDQKAPEVIFQKSGRWARGCAAYIKLPPFARNIHTWLHEIGHAIAPSFSKHHWPFCAVMVELTEEFFGPELAQRLRDCYDETGAKYRPQRSHLAKQPEWAVAADKKSS